MTGTEFLPRQMVAKVNITGQRLKLVLVFRCLRQSCCRWTADRYICCTLSFQSLVLTSAREVDQKTANEIRDAQQLGTMVNSQNDLYNRMARNTQRVATARRKATDAKKQNNITNEIRDKITNEKATRKESMLREKELQAELQALQGVAGASKRSSQSHTPAPANVIDASSSGRVRSSVTTRSTARTAANPYPAPGTCHSLIYHLHPLNWYYFL